MIAITTSSSMSVNACRVVGPDGLRRGMEMLQRMEGRERVENASSGP